MLYTRKGDTGTSKLFDCPQGVRISKDDIIFEALGTVDELNSSLGFAKALASKEGFNHVLMIEEREIMFVDLLESLQNNLFSLQAELAGSPAMVQESHIQYEEHVIEVVESVIPEVKTFLIPGGDVVSAYLDVCRTIARRAERLTVQASVEHPERISPIAIQFLNRFSSVMYALARFVNYKQEIKEKPPEYK